MSSLPPVDLVKKIKIKVEMSSRLNLKEETPAGVNRNELFEHCRPSNTFSWSLTRASSVLEVIKAVSLLCFWKIFFWKDTTAVQDILWLPSHTKTADDSINLPAEARLFTTRTEELRTRWFMEARKWEFILNFLQWGMQLCRSGKASEWCCCSRWRC